MWERSRAAKVDFVRFKVAQDLIKRSLMMKGEFLDFSLLKPPLERRIHMHFEHKKTVKISLAKFSGHLTSHRATYNCDIKRLPDNP